MNARTIFVFLVFFASWELISRSLGNPIFPPPSKVFLALFDLVLPRNLGFLSAPVESGKLVPSLLNTLKRVLMGFSLGSLAGFSLGILNFRFESLEKTIDPIVKVLHPIPGVSWIPISFLAFGESDLAVVFPVVIATFFPMLVNTTSGMKSVEEDLILAARNLGAKGIRFYSHVLIPATLPFVISGLRISWSYSWRTSIAAEMVLSLAKGGGLGMLHLTSMYHLDVASAMAIMLTIGVTGMALDHLVLGYLERRTLEKWEG